MQKLVIVFGLLAATFSLTANDAQQARFKVSKQLLKEMDSFTADSAGLDALIYVKSQKDFSGLKSLSSKSERGVFVANELRETNLKSQEALVELLDSFGVEYQRFYVANIVHVQGITPDQVLLVAGRNDVKRVVANPIVPAMKSVIRENVADSGPDGIESGVKYMKADQVWTKFKTQGEDIVIAGQDTGVDFQHPAIAKQYRGADKDVVNHDYNWYDAIQKGFEEAGGNNPCGYASEKPCDDNGHGTHTIGTIVGDDGKGNQIGMAPKAKWMACRNMDNGYGRPSSYIACFQFFLAPFPVKGNPLTDGDATKAPHVINNSWGCPKSEGCEGGEFVEVLENLQAAGILVVASAGNEGSECSTIADGPAHNSPTTLSVGALSASTGNIAYFSSRGPSTFDGEIGPDVAAPGVGVRSAIPGGGYASFSGTSMAGPHVVGHVALLWSAVPALRGDVEGTVALTRKSATPHKSTQSCGGVSGDAHPNNVFGWGDANTLKAIEDAQLSNPFVVAAPEFEI